MIAQNSEVYNPPYRDLFPYTCIMKKICRGIVYFTVLCNHPCLVSLLFAVLVSLHPVTFSNVFYYLFMPFFYQQRMQFAITEQKSVSSQVVGALALVYGQIILTPVFTLAEESDPSQPFLDGY